MPDGNHSTTGATTGATMETSRGTTMGVSDRFFERLPRHVHAGLTAEQRAAIATALR